MQFMKVDQIMFDPRLQMSRIFVEGFYQWLKYFSKDKDKLSQAVSHMFNMNCFFVAVEDDEIITFTACSDGKVPSVRLKREPICESLGWIRGNIAYITLKKHLTGRCYPFEFTGNMGSIEFVTTAEKHRKRGAAFGLISFIMENTCYREYVLEVADTNDVAMRLYKRLGFDELKRVPAPKKSGINYFVYMKKIQGSMVCV